MGGDQPVEHLRGGGDAIAVLDAPPGALAGYIGTRAWFAAATADPGMILRFTSIAVPLDIQP